MNIQYYRQYMYSYPHKTAYRPLDHVSLKDYISCLSGQGHGLYLHIPFCQAKCGYCNLFSVTGSSEEERQAYLDALKRQIAQYQALLSRQHTEFSDFTIGGGTPLLLSHNQLQQVFSMIREHFSFRPHASFVIETAPNQTEPEKLKLLKAAGVTRISMGIQSFSSQELNTLGRSHSPQKARYALSLLKEYEFPCVNVDFIYGVPGQSVDSLLASLKEGISFCPDEIFLYPLYIKHGVSLEQRLKEGMVLDQEAALLQYREASNYLRSQGYRQDSMRRFVKISSQTETRAFEECGFSSSLALGCGGRSYLGRLHFCTPYATTRNACFLELNRFIQKQDYTDITHGILLSDQEMKRRYLIRHLLILPGVSICAYKKRFSSSVQEDFPQLNKWRNEGYLEDKGEYLALSDRGMELSDYLGPQLISQEVRKKMEEWETCHGNENDFIQGQFKKL